MLYMFNKEDLQPKFCEIGADYSFNLKEWSQWLIIKKGDVVAFVERMLYYGDIKTVAGAVSVVAAPILGYALQSKEDWIEADKYIENYNPIPGGIFIDPTGKLIWISDIDLKYFEKIGP